MARRTAEGTANPARGALLVVVAVAVGLVLLRNGIDTSVQVTANDRPPPADESPAVDDPDAPDDAGDTPTTPVTEPARPPAEVRVLVLNASGVTGAAGRWSEGIGAYGYQMLPEGNAPERVEVTQVLHQDGFADEADQVVDAMGSPPGVTAAPIEGQDVGEIGDASVVVLVGPDIAEGAPPAPGEGGADDPAAGDEGADG